MCLVFVGMPITEITDKAVKQGVDTKAMYLYFSS